MLLVEVLLKYLLPNVRCDIILVSTLTFVVVFCSHILQLLQLSPSKRIKARPRPPGRRRLRTAVRTSRRSERNSFASTRRRRLKKSRKRKRFHKCRARCVLYLYRCILAQQQRWMAMQVGEKSHFSETQCFDPYFKMITRLFGHDMCWKYKQVSYVFICLAKTRKYIQML